MSVINKCKICRRLGTKLFLKGEKCLSPKCPMVRKPYPPGEKGKRRKGGLSEYGKELREKQKLRYWYNLEERQFEKYIKEALEKRGKIEDTSVLLIKKLESRLDNIIFRLGFAASRSQARQLVSHGHFLLNGRPVNIPSIELRKGDRVSPSSSFQKSSFFRNIIPVLKKHKTPSWLELDIKKFEGKVRGEPTLEEAAPPAEIPAIFEFYSR